MNDNPKKHPHAIALFSGGLDSVLAILLLLKQDIKVTALTFLTHFGCDLGDRSSCGSDPYQVAEKFGFSVKLMHLGEKFVDIVRDPKFGWGKNMNPCIDCRILMLNEAREFMEMSGAVFIVTGEVMGQRPMSQLKDKLFLTIKETGLQGKLLRPLSAKLLPPTDAELNGMVDRELLEGISGRGRKRQMEMAEEFGLDDYPSPASGCLLTDAAYSGRLRDLLSHSKQITFDDINLLRAGRHFRLNPQTKLVVGRYESDNKLIASCAQPEHIRLEAVEVGSPLTLLIGDSNEESIEKAAAITARYSAARKESQVEITVTSPDGQHRVKVQPATAEQLGITPVS